MAVQLDELLRKEIEGCHGQSERRAVADFVRDAIDGNQEAGDETAISLCHSLAEAALDLAKRIMSNPTQSP